MYLTKPRFAFVGAGPDPRAFDVRIESEDQERTDRATRLRKHARSRQAFTCDEQVFQREYLSPYPVWFIAPHTATHP
jgi:hypothetical protein